MDKQELQRAELAYAEARQVYDKACKVCAETWQGLVKARQVYVKAWRAYVKTEQEQE